MTNLILSKSEENYLKSIYNLSVKKGEIGDDILHISIKTENKTM